MTASIAIAVSGGIDSLVAAYLLKQTGADVFGIHSLTGFEGPAAPDSTTIASCCRQVAMPVVVVDLRHAFKQCVVDYFTDTYQAGETPNPCLVCNPVIKFGHLLAEARKQGATRLATGHYARIEAREGEPCRLKKGVDAAKDQSYFLARLTQRQLAQACFPLGDWTKGQVRALAAQKGLRPMTRQESQDVCFIRDTSYADFLTGTAGMRPQPGDIVDTAGRRIGSHDGLHRFTVGQRRGINCPASEAYYVVRIEPRHNRLVVGFKEELYRKDCKVKEINWIGEAPDQEMAVAVRIRYRHQAVPARLMPIDVQSAEIHFERPQAAVTPGQGAVFYRGEEVLGGGWISR